MKLYCPITIDLYKVYPLQVMEAQQGNVGRGAIVTLTAGSAVIDPTDETVEVYAKKPDGTVSWLECSVEDGKIKIDFTNQMLMSPGILQVELRMKDDEDDITTPIFKVKVNKSNVQSAGRSENELPLLDQIKKNAEDAKAAAEAAEKAVGDKITNPGIGAVGQILEVESVDEKGKPLTYKAVDKPEGGVDKELSQIIHASKYGMVSDGFSDTVIVIGKDAAAGDVIKYVIEENSGDITVIYDNNDTGEFNITTIDHAGEAAGEKTLTAEKYCTYTFPSEMDVYLPFNIPAKTSQLTDDVGFAKQEEVGKLSEEKANRIVETASGEVIVVTDSDEQKPLGLAIDGKSEQNQYSGKQLIDVSKVSKYPATGYVANDIGSLIKVSDTIPRGKVYYPIDISLLTGKEVKLSAKISKSISDVAIFVGATITSPSGNVYHNLATSDLSGVKTKTFVIPSDATSMQIDINVNDTGNALSTANTVTVENLMLCLSSVTDDTFEPFVGGKPSPSTEYQQEITNTGKYDETSGKYAVEVKGTKKNKLNCSGLVEQTKNGVTFTPVYDENNLLKYVEVNGTASADIAYRVNNLPSLLTNEYIFSGCPSGGSSTTYRLQYSNVVDYTYMQYGNEVVIKKFDYEKYPNSRVEIYISKGYTANKLRFYPMIRPVGTDSTYEPYKETTATVLLPQPLRKEDKAYWNGGSKVRVDRYRNVEVLDGSDDEGWLLQPTNNDNKKRVHTEKFKDIIHRYSDTMTKSNILCTHYKSVPAGSLGTYGCIVGISTDVLGSILIYDEEYNTSDISLWKAHLAENPITVEFELATPITEEIDIDLGELSMFYPTTILSNDCNANMEVEYIADTKNYIDKLKSKHESDITALKTAIVALGGTV